MNRGICQFCGCREHAACEGGCAWANAEETICTRCAAAVDIASELVTILGVIAAAPKSGMRLATARWELLPLEQRRTLVQTVRATVEGIQQALHEALEADVQEAIVELNAISGFLLERCPDRVGDEDTTSDVVIRLLEPYVGSRIVLPGDVSL